MIKNLKAVSGDKMLFRHWHQKFTTALGQFRGSYEEIVHRVAREIDFGKQIETVMTTLNPIYGDELWEA